MLECKGAPLLARINDLGELIANVWPLVSLEISRGVYVQTTAIASSKLPTVSARKV